MQFDQAGARLANSLVIASFLTVTTVQQAPLYSRQLAIPGTGVHQQFAKRVESQHPYSLRQRSFLPAYI